MRAIVDRLRTMGRRLPRGPAATSRAGRARRGRRRLLTPAICVAVAVSAGAIVAVAELSGSHRLSGLLGSHSASASLPVGPLPPTRLLALPPHALANGTRPLVVRLSAPPSPSSPVPTLKPAVAGTWKALGDTEVFTPVSTLVPCAT